MNKPSGGVLYTAINNTLNAIAPGITTALAGIPKQRNPAGDDDLYECFLYFEILHELQTQGATGFRAEPAGRPLDFKRGPGNFASTPTPFSYIAFEINNRDYEAHISTFVRTDAAMARCELDVCILDGAVRQSHPNDPDYRQVRIFIEAKYYSNDVELSLARQYVGLGHRMRGPNCFDAFVTCWGIDTSASALIQGSSRYSYNCFDNVIPGNVGALRSALAIAVASIF